MKPVRAHLGRLKRLAAVGVFGTVLAVAGSIATPSPAEAAVVTGQLKNAQTKRCLDANHAGNVYIRPCEVGNQHQTWEIVPTGKTSADGYGRFLISNKATGQCITMTSNNYPHGLLSTGKCTNVFWDNEPTTIDAVGSSFNSVSLRAQTAFTGGQPFCLGGNYEQAYAQVCNGSTSQKWARVTRG